VILLTCETCENRWCCFKLCDEVEAIVNQDHVPQKSGSVEIIDSFFIEEIEVPFNSGIELTEREKEILTLLCRNLTRKDIAQYLNISRNAIRWHIFNLRKKYLIS